MHPKQQHLDEVITNISGGIDAKYHQLALGSVLVHKPLNLIKVGLVLSALVYILQSEFFWSGSLCINGWSALLYKSLEVPQAEAF